MITPLDIVNHIRKYTKIFQTVGFVAELQRILDEAITYEPQMPACFVCFKSSNTTENESLNGYMSVEELEISVFIVLSEQEDLTGSTGMNISWTTCTSDLKSCLMNWIPNDITVMPMSYLGSQYVTMTGSRIVYEARFELEQQLTEQDGFVPQYDTLQEVDVDSKYFKDSDEVYELKQVIS